eukprot:Plantae.Rhodophyta-Rhodochaete_pulchella.ctg7958.p1 GENE.Plantae.Rhodophyta-Rhodochaete_pulchella.ctg7958~~Plantae.Rhodophyta-Rhodochaete_pulchella.ctg7958.p1  ORF type:complete len:155 (+),score=26.17 Plantae.Rhodophyta-Rhodochaete_pulchella.ctg7958:98-562(+)
MSRASFLKTWVKVDVYPLIAVMGLGVGTVGYFGYSKIRADPQMAWRKEIRLGGHDLMYGRPTADHHKTGLAYTAINWSPRIFGSEKENAILANKYEPSQIDLPVEEGDPEEAEVVVQSVEEVPGDETETQNVADETAGIPGVAAESAPEQDKEQ